MTGVLIRREHLDRIHSEGRQCEDIRKKQLSTNQRERTEINPSLIALRRIQPR